MNSTFDADAELYLSDVADAAVVTRLGAALREDSELRHRFVALARLHAHLGEIGKRSAAGDVGSARLLSVHVPTTASLPTVIRPGRRWWSSIAAVAALLALGLAVLSLAVIGLRTQALVPTVAATTGAVRIFRGADELPAANGFRLRAGDRIDIPDGSSLSIALVGGRCELSGGSSAVVETVDELHRRVVLEHGSMSADLRGRELFAVRTSAATISLADAAAAVEVSLARTTVRVSRGSVELQPNDGPTRRLDAGATWEHYARLEIARK
jgi:ferric-dicitrate binding protein FerR (iron transport regulator)